MAASEALSVILKALNRGSTIHLLDSVKKNNEDIWV